MIGSTPYILKSNPILGQMKKISSIILSSLVMLSGFTSCELKDELWGKETSNTSGQLQIALSNNASVKNQTRA